MTAPASVADAVRTFFRAVLTGDRDLLAGVALPHPDLDHLVPTRTPRPGVAPLLAELPRLQLRHDTLPGERHFVQAFVGGELHLLVLRDTLRGPRIDLRYALGALQPDDERRAVARAFYGAMLFGDADALRELAFDARGVELLAEHRPPAGEHAQLAHVVATLGFAELAVGEPFTVPNGVQFVSERHAEMGIAVFSGLCPSGELPFLLRQRDGAWKVIPFHFVQAAAQARGATASS